jgi:hypothetical protein
MRRDKDDEQWQEAKKIVFARDKSCRVIQVLTAVEFLILQKNAGIMLNRFDPAHVFGVGSYPKLIYDINNIVKLNRYSHECLDTMRCPIDGNPITKEEKRVWWERIIGTQMYESLLNKLKEKEDGRIEGSSDKD